MLNIISSFKNSPPPPRRFSQTQKRFADTPNFSGLSKTTKQTLTISGACLAAATALITTLGIGYGNQITPEIATRIKNERKFSPGGFSDECLTHLSQKQKDKIVSGDYFLFIDPTAPSKRALLFDDTGKVPVPKGFVRLCD